MATVILWKKKYHQALNSVGSSEPLCIYNKTSKRGLHDFIQCFQNPLHKTSTVRKQS